MINSTEKEKNLGIFHQMQTAIMLAKMTKIETQTNTALKILPPAIMNLIGVYLLMSGKLDHLLALVVFMQEEDGFGSDELICINETLIKASAMANAQQQTIDNIYNTNFTSIIELIGNRKEALLRKAAQAGNELAVVQLLKIDGIDVNAKDNAGWTALMRAAIKGHTSIITQLLNVKGIAVNAKGNIGWTALMYAASNGHSSVVTGLLNVDGILVNDKNNDGYTALMLAASNGHSSVVTELLNVDGILVNAKGNHGQTALMIAAVNGHTSIVIQLLNTKDIDVSEVNRNGWTALMYAAGNGHTSVVIQLLNTKDIAVNAKDNHDRTALIWAARHRHTSIVHQLCVKQLFDAPYGQGDKLFQQLTNEVKSVNDSMTINTESLCAYFLKSVEALPTDNERMECLHKALSKTNAFSALMQNEHRLQIEQALTKLNPPQEAQSSDNPQPVIFSGAPVASSSSSNTAHASLRLISNQ